MAAVDYDRSAAAGVPVRLLLVSVSGLDQRDRAVALSTFLGHHGHRGQ